MSNVLLTFDTDWCPDFMMEPIISKLKEYKIKSTWFVTHDSPVIQEMKNEPLIELGLHPNFHPDSTQGTSFDTIMNNLLKIVPNAESVRTHTLLWSSRFYEKFRYFRIKYDSSLILFNSDGIQTNKIHSCDLTRFPIFWEDDIALMENKLGLPILDGSGLKVLNFHPVHIYLNSTNIESYNRVKKSKDWDENVNIKYGIKNIFESVLINLHYKKTSTMQEFVWSWD